jgi:hypothetical protein
MRRVHNRRSCDRKRAGWELASDCDSDEDLVPSERRFRHDGTKATRFYEPDDGDDQMNEKDEDVVHAGIVSKSQKLQELRPIL